MPIEKQIAIIYCGTQNLLKDIPVNKIKQFEDEFLHYLEIKKKNILESLKNDIFNQEIENELIEAANQLIPKYKN